MIFSDIRTLVDQLRIVGEFEFLKRSQFSLPKQIFNPFRGGFPSCQSNTSRCFASGGILRCCLRLLRGGRCRSLCTAVLEWVSECKTRGYYHFVGFGGVSYLAIFVHDSVATVRHIIIAIIVLIWLESGLRDRRMVCACHDSEHVFRNNGSSVPEFDESETQQLIFRNGCHKFSA